MSMKTIPEYLLTEIPTPHWWRVFVREYQDIECFIIGHRYTFIGSANSGKGGEVCRRCNRCKNPMEDCIFYHNWEMDRGSAARCHVHLPTP